MERRILVLAYMGTGKTELENSYENVVDFDFQDYKYIYDESIRHLPLEERKGSTNLRTENSNYPENFIKDAIKFLKDGKIVVSPFIDHVFKAYEDFDIRAQIPNLRIILVFPEKDNFEEYVKRFRQRGNSEEFISRRRKEFPCLISLFEQANEYERLLVKPGQYLSDVLLENGINLKTKKVMLKK